MAISDTDVQYLRRALTLAERAHGHTAPNPMVGAVIVRDGVVVGEGYHHKAGEPHAEVLALRAAGTQAHGATIYVSLEPCSHQGRTPPCCVALPPAGIVRVVFCSLDPNPKVAGRGAEYLRTAGLIVEHGALAEREEQLNEAWRYWIATRRPFITVKLASTLDGRIATATGESKWITGTAARRDVHRLRATQDAIFTTANTVIADDPELTARLPDAHQPRRVVLDTYLRTNPTARVYAPAERPPLLYTAVLDEAKLAPFRVRGVEVVSVPADAAGLSLSAVMENLGQREVLALMTECGGTLAAALIRQQLAHKLRLYQAPKLIGGDGLPVLGGLGVEGMDEVLTLKNLHMKRVGEDWRLEGYLHGMGG